MGTPIDLALIRECTARALAAGALAPIETTVESVAEGGFVFAVRILARPSAKSTAQAGRNPFAPYEPDLFVAELGPGHLGLLNKYPVMPDHLLIVTREFEDQERPLTRPDLEALWRCLAVVDGLGFYNGGAVAGASLRHKHLQLVPLPLAPFGPPVPLGPAFLEGAPLALRASPALSFAHRYARLPPGLGADPAAAAGVTHALYQEALAALCLGQASSGRLPPYNLLVTREWLLAAPRAAECFGRVSVNALGLAGALLVRTEELESLRRAGPLAVLRSVTGPPR